MDYRVRQSQELIAKQLSRPPRVDALASSMGLSPSRLRHLFRNETGMSIRAFIKDSRLRRAANLLSETYLRVSEICYAVGFQDLSNFSRAFHSKYGVGPRAYRVARQRPLPILQTMSCG
jgi:AraC family transcriptional regulator of arabinose operon